MNLDASYPAPLAIRILLFNSEGLGQSLRLRCTGFPSKVSDIVASSTKDGVRCLLSSDRLQPAILGSYSNGVKPK